MKRAAVMAMACLMAGSCAEMQVKRDLNHSRDVQHYKAAAASAEDFDPVGLCKGSVPLKTWQTFEFSESSKIYALPNGVSAAAYCLAAPSGARAIEINGQGNQKGMSYHDSTAIHPSLIFLDQDHKVMSDLREPRFSPREGLSGLGVSGIVTLVDTIASAKFVIVYVHPSSTSGGITVYARSTIPVPYGPYGTVKIRFL